MNTYEYAPRGRLSCSNQFNIAASQKCIIDISTLSKVKHSQKCEINNETFTKTFIRQ